MKKLIVLLLAAALIFTVLAGCGGNTASSGGATPPSKAPDKIPANDSPAATLDPNNPVTITFYSYSLSYPTMRPGMEHLINNFNETTGKEKGVFVKAIEDDTMGKYQTDIAAGEQVNVIQHAFSVLDMSKENLGLQAYEDIFPTGELSEHISHMYENAVELGKIDGKTYALAFTFSTPILYINGALFEAAGLDPNEPPETWDEVAAYAKRIYESTGKPGFALSPQNGWTTEGLFFSNGANILNSDRTEAVFASPEGIEAMEMWQVLYHSGAHALGSDSEVSEQFMSGNAGMLIQSTSMLSGIKAGAEAGGWKLYGAEMPAFGDKPAVPVNSGSALAVRSSSELENLAIWEFIKYVTGPEGYTIITSEIGYLPLNKDIVSDPQYLKPFVDENPIIATNLRQLERLRPVTIWPAENALELRQIFADAITKAITTGNDAGEVLKEAQEQMNALLK
jgi:multiple sugar transport system substrate-binding protein